MEKQGVSYVIKTNGSTKLTPKSMNMNGSDDQFYRYKMRQLYVQVVGKGKMIKTALLNIDDVARDMKVPPSYYTAYLGYEVGAQAKYDGKKPEREKASISGDLDAPELSMITQKFIQEFVMCPLCNLPETTVRIDKKTNDIIASCRGCGAMSTLNLKPKFKSFILNHPMDLTSKEERAVKKKQAAATKDAQEKGSESTNQTSETTENNSVTVAKKEKPKKKKEDEEDGVEWSFDTSEDAVKERRRQLLPAKLEELVAGNQDEKEKEVSPVETLRKLIQEQPTDVFGQFNKFQTDKGLEVEKALEILFEALFEAGTVPAVKSHLATFKKIIKKPSQELVLLKAIEKHFSELKEDVLKKIPLVVKSFYDADVLSEESILKWNDGEVKASIKKAMEPFITWLKTAEEEEDDD